MLLCDHIIAYHQFQAYPYTRDSAFYGQYEKSDICKFIEGWYNNKKEINTIHTVIDRYKGKVIEVEDDYNIPKEIKEKSIEEYKIVMKWLTELMITKEANTTLVN